MKLAIVGYGKMGKETETLARELGHEISIIIDLANQADIEKISHENTDVMLEFTNPGSVVQHISFAMEIGIPIVTGTTGWFERLDEVNHMVEKYQGALFYASNFSLGVNLYFEMAKRITDKLNFFKQYKPAITEIHHTRKLDAPSGTAISLATHVLPFLDDYFDWTSAETAEENKIPVFSVREGDEVGTHILVFESENDKMEWVHKAKNRKEFASGAIMAASFLKDKKGIFTMSDLIN